VSKIHIVTDSSATINPEAAKQFGITVMPLTVRIDHKDYEDGTDLGHEKLLLNMGQDRIHPKIVGPTAEQFQRVYNQLLLKTDQIISIHSSAKLSSIHREAQIAARGFLGRCDIIVIDSETISLGLGLLVQKMAQWTHQSMSLDDIVRRTRGMIQRIYIALATDTLDYLEHSRRISATQAILGNMLDIRPFLTMEKGEIIPLEKVRKGGWGLDKLTEFANEFSNIERIAILQSTHYPTEKTKELQERLEGIAPGHEFPILLYGPLLASHIGPDGTGLIVYENPGRKRMP